MSVNSAPVKMMVPAITWLMVTVVSVMVRALLELTVKLVSDTISIM